MSRELIANPCQSKCSWLPTSLTVDERQVFACAGCGSEWTTAQAWTPRNADGEVSPAVAQARAAAPAQ